MSKRLRHVLLHIHVPRASGSSLHGWFLKALGDDSVIQANDADDVCRAVADRHAPDRPAVVSGHFCHGVHERLAGHPHRYVVLLRDPVERVLSLFRYARSLPGHKLHAVLNQPGMTVARFYREKVPSGLMRNGMVAQLAGILGTRTVPTESHLARADIHLLQSGAMFGLAEDPAPLLAQAARFLQIKQPPPFPEVNRLAAVDRQERDEDRAAIVAANQLDLELYRRAREQLNRSRASWPHRLMPWLR